MRRPTCLIILTFAALLAACAPGGAATPALIGAYRDGTAPLATHVPPPVTSAVVYSAVLDLAVADVGAAAGAAAQIAADHGGYLSEATSWTAADKPYATLTLVIPSAQYDRAHRALLGLGTLNRETATGDLLTGNSAWTYATTFTINLSPAPGPLDGLRLPALPNFGWNPMHTFGAAFRVFAAIFTFLADAAIWLTVVFGPFVLLALGLRRLFRPARPASTAPTPVSHPEEKTE